MTTLEILKTTKSAWRDLNRANSEEKNKILSAMADALVENTAEIISKNAVDMENAKGKISDVMLDRLMLETDCPYLAPEPHRGKRNSSLYIPYIAEEIANLKGITYEEVVAQTEQNARALFRVL